ncbi:hypothetical protein KOE80_04605 [Alcaligenes sp. 13f]|uniref:hypothetical protein n=1 Tax=Alcaligenes sp. 13f TaxID=2841924 RepID=UPI001CF66445|nr:hypothetical protein [Alcaligenes sp. 13f]MCB4321484.1 hypothetical protein [Alcaligenes sp. 13f]
MVLRKKIEQVITAASGNSEKAAFEVCLLLEDAIGLNGNGWFDDDEEMQKLLSSD